MGRLLSCHKFWLNWVSAFGTGLLIEQEISFNYFLHFHVHRKHSKGRKGLKWRLLLVSHPTESGEGKDEKHICLKRHQVDSSSLVLAVPKYKGDSPISLWRQVEQPFLEAQENRKLRNTAEFMKSPPIQKHTTFSSDPWGFQPLGSKSFKKALQFHTEAHNSNNKNNNNNNNFDKVEWRQK